MCVCVSVSMAAEGKARGVNRIMKDTGHKGAISFKIYLHGGGGALEKR